MKTKNKKELVLSLIQKNDGKWTWYQLDRAIGVYGHGGKGNLAAFLNELTKDGLVLTQVTPSYPHPLYCLTALGKAWLETNDVRKMA